MEKLKKFLSRLTPAEREKVEQIITAILSGRYQNLDLKKLKGHRDIFRVRVGSIRIIFTVSGTDIHLLEISRRDDTTYRNY